jgi:hypothetical protein
MRRASNPVRAPSSSARGVWLSALLAVAGSVLAPEAWAQTCQSARPTEPEGTQGVGYAGAPVSFLDAPSGRARVHYALSGPHAPPAASTLETDVPDAVVVAAHAADDALDKYDELGYLAPLGDADSPCGSNGDSDAIDVYLINFSAADGQAALDHCEPGTLKHCAGFILVENDFRSGGYADVTEGMRTVVPHELFHLVQDAYDADVERWWAEGSAQWAAKQVYPDLRDLERFLPAYFESPWRPLNVPPNGVVTNFLYATAIWPVFLGERFDPQIVREVHEAFGQGAIGVLPTTDAVLHARGSSLAEAFLQFAAYNAATGERAPAAGEGGYVDAADYPLVGITALGSAEGELVSEVDSGLGAFYYSVSADPPRALELQADPARVAGLLVPLVAGKLELTRAEPLPATLEGDGVVVVAGQSLSRTDAPFTLQARRPSVPVKGDAGETSGCSVVRNHGQCASRGSATLGFVVILLGRCRARKRPRKGG